MNPGLIIATLVPMSLFTLIFGISYLKNKSNMALIEKGINPYNRDVRPRPFVNLKFGLLFIGAGLGLLVAYLLDYFILGHKVVVTNFGINERDSDNPAIYFALIAIGGGLGLFYSYKIEKKEWLDKQKGDVDRSTDK